MSVTLDQMRAYARLDDDAPESDVSTLQMCLSAAEEWFTRAGVPGSVESSMRDLGVQMLALSWYENRGNDGGIALHTVPQGVYAIKHLLCELPDAAGGTDDGAVS